MTKKITLDNFKKSFARIRNAGWIRSKRRGPTGIGQTLEQLLGLDENNIALPDLGKVELKAHRIGSASMITLFTFNRKAWKMKPLDAVRKYGTSDRNGRLGLYFTMSRTPNSMGLFLHVEVDRISVRHISGEIIAEWQLDVLAERFMQKLPGLVLVGAFSEMRGDIEWFKFDRAQLLTGTSPEIIRNQILAGNVLFDIRFTTRAPGDDASFLVNGEYIRWLFKEWTDI
jgi:hypothetical protein